MPDRAIDLDMMVGLFQLVSDARERYLGERPDLVAAIAIQAVTAAGPCRTIFQHRAKIFVDVVDKKYNLRIDPIEIWEYHMRFCNNIDDVFVILAQQVRENLPGFEILVVVGDDPAVPVVIEQSPVAGPLPGGA